MTGSNHKSKFLPEHIENGDVYKGITFVPCCICHTETNLREPVHKGPVCSVECLIKLYNTVDKVLEEEIKNEF
jgi:hypothetical protein